jgi:hypothetical protein
MNLSRPVRVVLTVVATVASVVVALSGLPLEAKTIASSVLTIAAALGIVPLHLDVVEEPASPVSPK